MTGKLTARKRRLLVLGVVAASALLGLAGAAVPRGQGFVDRVSIVNASEYDIRVEVSGDGTGWMNLMTADRSSTTVASDVLDQGDVWFFRFAAQGRVGGDLRVPRPDLQQSGWVLDIPREVVERLRQLGAPPTP